MSLSDNAALESTPLDPASLESTLRERLAEVEAALLQTTVGGTPLVTEAAQHLVAAGGKRFRPTLVVLAAELGPAPAPVTDVIRASLVVELTHVASLYHDDVMDEADLRRAAPSANARWGNTVAILVGDFLFARASEVVADLGPEYVRLQARTFARLVQGQIAETVGPADADPVEHYLSVVADKTASLIATSAMFGAKVAGADPSVQQAMAAYGEEIGTVFQLSDDIIDITSDETGKPSGIDLREGISTLPTLLFRRMADPTSVSDLRLLELLDSDLSDDASLSEALGLLRAHPCIAAARAEVQTRADRARAHLDQIPAGAARDALAELCDTVVTRSS